MAGSPCRSRECVGPVTGPVVGHDPLDTGDAVCGEPGSGSVQESDCGGGFLVRQHFGVGEAGMAIDGGVQVQVAAAGTAVLTSRDGAGVVAVAAVGAPAAAVGDAPDLLHVKVNHVAWPGGDDRSRCSV